MRLKGAFVLSSGNNDKMPNVSITTNADELSRSILEYIKVSGKSIDEALKKQGSKLGYNLRQELRKIAPAKGAIRAQLLARLNAGQGIRVRPKILARARARRALVRGSRRLSVWQLAVQGEINAREAARGFLGFAATYQGSPDMRTATSRFGPVLSKAIFHPSPAGGAMEFDWGGYSELSQKAAEGITKPKGERALNNALVGTLEDIEVYLARKLGEDWERG